MFYYVAILHYLLLVHRGGSQSPTPVSVVDPQCISHPLCDWCKPRPQPAFYETIQSLTSSLFCCDFTTLCCAEQERRRVSRWRSLRVRTYAFKCHFYALTFEVICKSYCMQHCASALVLFTEYCSLVCGISCRQSWY